jgi:hypothetical protein
MTSLPAGGEVIDFRGNQIMAAAESAFTKTHSAEALWPDLKHITIE